MYVMSMSKVSGKEIFPGAASYIMFTISPINRIIKEKYKEGGTKSS